MLLDLLDKFPLKKVLKEIDGVYAFAFQKNKTITLVRDIIGVKPMWFSSEGNFAFCSEKKVLKTLNYENIQELNPRTILTYNINSKYITTKKRENNKERSV